MMPLIRTVGITRVYGTRDAVVRALDGIDLEIGAGEFVAIMGPSGSGKSTLMGILGLLDRPDDGRYLFSGEDVGTFGQDRLAEYRNRHVGFVFQGFNLLPRLDVVQNVELPLVYRGLPRAERRNRAEAALDMVGLARRSGHRPQQLSGGEQQRVAIARALVGDPLLILADEPTGALDSATGVGILALFQRLNEKGRTIALITHDSVVAEHAGRVVVLRDGRLAGDRAASAKRTVSPDHPEARA